MLRVFDVDGRGGGCCAVLAYGEAACGAEDVKSRGPLEEGEGRGRGMVVEIKKGGDRVARANISFCFGFLN